MRVPIIFQNFPVLGTKHLYWYLKTKEFEANLFRTIQALGQCIWDEIETIFINMLQSHVKPPSLTPIMHKFQWRSFDKQFILVLYLLFYK